LIAIRIDLRDLARHKRLTELLPWVDVQYQRTSSTKEGLSQMKRHLTNTIAVTLLLLGSAATSAIGQDGSDDEMPIGIPDLMIFTDGEAELRSGVDSTFDSADGLRELGIVFDADVTLFYQGVTSGGREQEFPFGGHGDYVLNLGGEKLLGQEGLFLQCGPNTVSAKTSIS